MTTQAQTIFFVSDSTGITVDRLGHSLLSQFEGLVLNTTSYRYVDSMEKARKVAALIRIECAAASRPVVVFTTIVNPDVREVIFATGCQCFDLFETFLAPVSEALGGVPVPFSGRSHRIRDDDLYHHRMEAVNYALRTDDGVRPGDYSQADIILTGVSRSGKTPTCLYMALHYGLFVANYPLIDEELDAERLPDILRLHRHKLFGLLVAAERLHRIRTERRPGSEYASFSRCQYEVRRMESLLQAEHIPYLQVTSKSVEEIATSIITMMEIQPQVYSP